MQVGIPGLVAIVAGATGSIGSATVRALYRSGVNVVLAALPDQYRLIITLREIDGLSYDEIAEAMECSLDSVKARLKRARQAFVERLRHLSAAGDV